MACEFSAGTHQGSQLHARLQSGIEIGSYSIVRYSPIRARLHKLNLISMGIDKLATRVVANGEAAGYDSISVRQRSGAIQARSVNLGSIPAHEISYRPPIGRAFKYEMLTRERPFAGGSLVEILVAVARDDPPRPSRENARVSRELDRIVFANAIS